MFYWQKKQDKDNLTNKETTIPVPLKDSGDCHNSKTSDGGNFPDSGTQPLLILNQCVSGIPPEIAQGNQKSSERSNISANQTLACQKEQEVSSKWSWFSKGLDTTGTSPSAKSAQEPSEKPQKLQKVGPYKDELHLNETSSVKQAPTRNNQNAWAFWSKQGVSKGQLAVSGTSTEHNPRKMEARKPILHEEEPPKTRKVQKSMVVPDFSSIKWPSRTSRFAHFLWNRENSSIVQRNPAKPRRVIIIGVHGYFPARMTRAILGEPTGTSLKFANEAESRFQHWFRTKFPQEEVPIIDKVALEGEGRIANRISLLYDLLMNWQHLLVQADLIFFAVHSQGAVVTASIVNRLLEDGFLNLKRQKVTVLSMAGSWLGPMPGMDQTLVMRAITRIEHDSLLELFELQNMTSSVSENLQRSLANVLQQGVKIVLVGSCNDQLIPLYSALALNVQHPNLFRAAYIDGEEVRSEVVGPLLNLSLLQLNQGNHDHGVIKELSALIAGTLTSKGHSKLYSHDEVYDLAINITLMTSTVTNAVPKFTENFKIVKNSRNPYVLPWVVSEMIGDCEKSKELAPLVDELLNQFRKWRPETKPMKDLKWQLAGLSNSKL